METKPRQQGRKNPARNKPGGPQKPSKGRGSYNRQKEKLKCHS